MAGNDSKQVSVGKPIEGGALYAAPPDTSYEKNAITPLKDPFIRHGYVSEDGMVNGVKNETTDFKAWGGTTVLTVRTSRSETYKWTFIQAISEAVLKEVYGEQNISITDGVIEIKHNNLDLPRRMFVFDILLTDNQVKRIVVPNAQITEVGDVTYKDDALIGYEVTLSAYPDADGNTAYEYLALTQAPTPQP